MDALYNMLDRQSNISTLNIAQAEAWKEADPELASLAQLVIDVARIHPRKRKRIPFLRQSAPELLQRMIDMDLVPFDFDKCEDRFSDVSF